MNVPRSKLGRREFLRYGAVAGLSIGLDQLVPAYAWQLAGNTDEFTSARRRTFDLRIEEKTIRIGDRKSTAVTINGTVPGPLLRIREGESVTLRVRNDLNEDTSIHWHGLIVPDNMDGVPGVSFPGIGPGETFIYRYPVIQSGTYWYHSHSGLQEQEGHYGPLIIDPINPEPFQYDREHVVMFSDWLHGDPHTAMAKLKKQAGYYNFQRRTVGDFWVDVNRMGLGATLADRLQWAQMRMDATDIADITGYAYTYLMNGMPPGANWTGLFKPGERVRLRLINGSAMTYFNVRIPGLKMTVVQADGQNVEPVVVDELQIAVAETFDVIVEPTEQPAYTIFAESMDRSGFARGTLAIHDGLSAPVPELRATPERTMLDMGMSMDEHSGMQMNNGDGGKHGGMHGGQHSNSAPTDHMSNASPTDEHGAGADTAVTGRHGPNTHGPGNSSIAEVQRNRLSEPGTGLVGVDHRVLIYTDLRNVEPSAYAKPEREIELHLTGNMDRYMWSFDGVKFSNAGDPIPVKYNQPLRITLVNDTMMEHPIHIHGMWMLLLVAPDLYVRKHTVNVKPAERLSFDILADNAGNWAFHCHLLYHMEMGMMRVFNVSPRQAVEP